MTLEEFNKLSNEEARALSDDEKDNIMSQLRQKINTHLEIGKKEPEKGFYFGPLDDD